MPGKWNRFLSQANSRRESPSLTDWKIKRGCLPCIFSCTLFCELPRHRSEGHRRASIPFSKEVHGRRCGPQNGIISSYPLELHENKHSRQLLAGRREGGILRGWNWLGQGAEKTAACWSCRSGRNRAERFCRVSSEFSQHHPAPGFPCRRAAGVPISILQSWHLSPSPVAQHLRPKSWPKGNHSIAGS